MEFHEAANIFPLMEGRDFDALVEDIREHGLRDPIWRHEGKIIDGRNRYRACEKAGKKPHYQDWDGKGSLISFIVSMNLHRRHLSASQRAMIGAKLATWPRHITKNRPSDDVLINTSSQSLTTPEAAEMLNVGGNTVQVAKHVRREAIPEVVAAVESGEITLHAAKQIVAEPKDEQRAALKAKREGLYREPKSSKNGNGMVTRTRKLAANRNAPKVLRGAIDTLVSIATGLDSFTAKDAAPTAEEAEQWEKELALVISSVNRFRRQLKELSNV